MTQSNRFNPEIIFLSRSEKVVELKNSIPLSRLRELSSELEEILKICNSLKDLPYKPGGKGDYARPSHIEIDPANEKYILHYGKAYPSDFSKTLSKNEIKK